MNLTASSVSIVVAVVAALGALAVAVFNFVSSRGQRRADIAVKVSEAWAPISERIEKEREDANQKWRECQTTLDAVNRHSNARDVATWNFLEKQHDHDDAAYRVIDTLERIALRVMTTEEQSALTTDMTILREQRKDLVAAGLALRKTLYQQ